MCTGITIDRRSMHCRRLWWLIAAVIELLLLLPTVPSAYTMSMAGHAWSWSMRRRADDNERIDDGQTNSVSFDTICLAVERRSEPVDADGLTTDRRILFFLTESVWPSITGYGGKKS